MDKVERKIDNNVIVKATIAGDSIKITTALGSDNPVMRRFNKDYMINTRTAELVKIKHADSRTDIQNLRSLRKTFERIRLLINANFQGGRDQLLL